MRFDWNSEKNELLKESCKLSFEEIATLLAAGKVWKVMDHPNPDAYPNQRVFLVPINNYIYFVSFVFEGDVIFLKTAFPNRKASKQYLSVMVKRGRNPNKGDRMKVFTYSDSRQKSVTTKDIVDTLREARAKSFAGDDRVYDRNRPF